MRAPQPWVASSCGLKRAKAGGEGSPPDLLGVKMVNSGGTILSGAHVRSSAASASITRGRARTLLLSSALATVLAGVVQPGVALADCAGNASPNPPA